METEPKRALSLGSRFRGFQDLMRYRVQDILLVSNLYDSFILSEDGHLSELILNEVLDLNLRHTPGLTHVTSGAEALELAREQRRHNLIISSIHVGDMDPLELARAVKREGLGIPAILLAYDNRELTDFVAKNPVSDFDRIFLWQGDARILLAITKYVEDRLNVEHDTGTVGVQAILVIEDNIRFYSSFLPMIYTEVMNHAHQLMPEGINLSHKLMRLRARPKILLCSQFEEAWDYFERYQENILGVLSDIEFPKGGQIDRQAGLEFARKVRERQPDVPVLLQSSQPKNQQLAHAAGATFLLKGSPVLLQQLRQFMLDNFGFGDFVFRRTDGSEIDRAHDLKSLEEKLYSVPAECLAYHGARNHFSNWLKARTEFDLAHRLRPRKVADFGTLEHLRRDLIRALHQYRRERQRGTVADFDRSSFDAESLTLTRLGGGSIGGKARGLAFANLLLSTYAVSHRFAEVEISVPPSVVVGTDVFDRFLEDNELRDFALQATDDQEILARFLTAPFPEDAAWDLAAFLEQVNHPLAVRSSSLLEDSPYQPLAGVYETYMLPNNHPDLRVRRQRLINAIKRIYASTFSSSTKAFLRSTPYRLEEEKMAVILQRMVGATHQDRFYPDFAGVARSLNFYPTAPMSGRDGIVAVALGLGETVAKGGVCVRFCPKYPRHLVQFSSVQEVLHNSQREFYALVLRGAEGADPRQQFGLDRFDLVTAEQDGTLGLVGSTYSPENDAVYDGLARPGVRLVSFAPVLKQRLFPLAEILDLLLELGEHGTSAPVEIEFAVNLSTPGGFPHEFGFLQMRPLSRAPEVSDLDLGQVDRSELICSSSSVLGNGVLEELRDLLVVDFHRFERAQSLQVAQQVARFNAELGAAGSRYILIGVGRWGSIDPLLGIPVAWDQISGAQVIVESGFRDFVVTPSQGTHFFQNLIACNVGYFTVNPQAGGGFIDWEWLAAQPARKECEFVRLLHFDAPLTVKMNGRANQGVILKPRETASR